MFHVQQAGTGLERKGRLCAPFPTRAVWRWYVPCMTVFRANDLSQT